MKLVIPVLLGALLLFSMTACATSPAGDGGDSESGSAESAYHKITAEEAKEMIDAGDVVIVDVRTAEEYAAEHIPNAMNIPNETIDSGGEAPDGLPDLDAVLLIHCRTGIRSKQAADKLVELGYTNLYDFGGINNWPYDTVTEP